MYMIHMYASAIRLCVQYVETYM